MPPPSITASEPRPLISSHCSTSPPRTAGRHHREVGRRAVRVDVGEAAADPRRPGPSDAGASQTSATFARTASITLGVELLEAVPGDRASRRFRRAPRRRRRCRAGRGRRGRRAARRRPADCSASPPPEPPLAGPRPGSPPCSRAISTAISIGSSTGWWADSKPRTSRLARAGPAPVVPASSASSRRQLDGLRPGLGDLAHRPRGGEEVVELDPAGGLEASGRGRTRTQASAITPRIPSEPISTRSGRGARARARQPPALPGPARGDRPHRLDQVVDVGVEGREVAAGPGRDPAAEGRVLERLREVAQGQAVLAQLLLEHRARSPRPGSAPPATPGRPPAPGRAAAGRA